jgi:hypothetical protein
VRRAWTYLRILWAVYVTPAIQSEIRKGAIRRRDELREKLREEEAARKLPDKECLPDAKICQALGCRVWRLDRHRFLLTPIGHIECCREGCWWRPVLSDTTACRGREFHGNGHGRWEPPAEFSDTCLVRWDKKYWTPCTARKEHDECRSDD